MQWFKNGYDRASVADYVLQAGQTEEVCPGLRRTSWSATKLGGLAIMNHHQQRFIFNPESGRSEPEDWPFYSLHFTYKSPQNDSVSALIDFDANFAYLKRSSEYASRKQSRPNEVDIWDQAMAAFDESLLEHAQSLGWGALVIMVERIPEIESVSRAAA